MKLSRHYLILKFPAIYTSIASKGGQWEQEQVAYKDDRYHGAFEILAFQSSQNKVVILFSDISKRILAEESLRVSEEKFSKAFRNLPRFD